MDSPSNGLGKLLPKAIAAKRRRSRASSPRTAGSSDDAAGVPQLQRAGTAGSDTTSTATPTATATSPASGSLHGADNDSGPESSNSTTTTNSVNTSQLQLQLQPAALSTHPSQTQTTSSPSPESARSAPSARESTDSLESRGRASLGLPELRRQRSSSASRLRELLRPKKTLGDEKSSPAPEADPPAEPPAAPPKPVAAGTRPSSSEHSRRLSRGQKPEPLQAPPQTPPAEESSPAPLIIHTPPTPTDSQPPSAAAAGSIQRPANAALAASNMITQRRRTSSNAGPSKSSAPSAPLTPTPENAPAAPGNPASTFFSSMFSAVQNTASSLSTTIPALGQGPGKGRNAPAKEQPEDEHPDAVVEVEPSAISRPSTEPKEPAVKTLGMGDLSLSHLGIVDAPSPAPSPVKARVGGETETRARSESAPADPNAVVAGLAAEGAQVSRAVSLHEGDEKAPPPTGGLYEAKTDVRRSGSIRSAIGQRRNRDRGGSVATHGTTGTGGTVGAAIAAANSSVAHPGAPASGPKLTGFAVANKKRNRDFHALFKSVPDDDYLIEDYSCALQREILAHGRLYISEGHLCFSSNILGWVTTLVMSFDEIVSVEKRSTALVFKNGLEISTLHAKHIFASFASRDTTYDLIVKIWKLGHPHLQSTLNGVRLEEPGGDRTERIETESASAAGTHSASASDDESGGGGGGGDGDDDDDDDDEDVYDEDEDDAEGPDAGQSPDGPAAAADAAEKTATRKASGALAPPEKRSDDGAPAGGGADFPGPAAHAPTDCGDAATHYDKVVADDVIAAPLGKVFTLLFGAASAAWMGRWLSADQKCTDIQMEDRRGLSDEVRSRTYSYIKPLSASIGPKQTKCIVTEQLEHLDFEKAVNINISTQNPDVPNGNIFVVKTKYCLTWAENNATRVQVNCTIEWSGKSWLKGAIERGANEGQTQYCKDLFASLKAAVSSRPRAGTPANGAARARKRARRNRSALASHPASDGEGAAAASAKQNWGVFEPARPVLGPVVDTIRPILTGNVVYGLLVGLLVASWFGFGLRQGAPRYTHDPAYANYAHRMAAYDEMWRREESELWDWLEERVGLERLGADPPLRKRSADPRTVEEKLREDHMDEREIREAIRVTEEHLEVLKAVVDRRGEGGR